MTDECPHLPMLPAGKTKHFYLAVLLLTVAVSSVGADPRLFEPIVVDEGWRFRPGDDIRWAEPDFDDSSWPHVVVPGSWGSQGYGAIEVGWYRLTVEPIPEALAGPDGHLGIRLGPVVSEYRLFAGGKELSSLGWAGSSSSTEFDRHRIFAIPSGAVREGRLVLALRVVRHAVFGTSLFDSRVFGSPIFGSGFGGIQRIAPELGRLDDLARRESRQDAPGLMAATVCGFIGIFAVFFSRGRRPMEGRWLGLMLISVAMVTWLNSQWRFVLMDDFVVLKKAEIAFRFLILVLWMQWLMSLGDRFWSRNRRVTARFYQLALLIWTVSVVLMPGLELGILSSRGWLFAVLPLMLVSVPILLHLLPAGSWAWGLKAGAGMAFVALAIDAGSGMTGLTRPLLVPFGFLGLGMAWTAARELRFQALAGRLVALRASFDQRLEERTQDLSNALERAESLSQSRIELFASVSHEIRTPMMGILGVGNLLLKRKLKAEERGYAQTIRSSALALLGVLNDILDFSKIEAGHLALKPEVFELREAVRGVVELLQPKAEEKRIELLCHVWPEAPEWVLGDPWRLRQVLINLVGNAIKFTQDGKVILEVLPARRAAGSKSLILRFAVVDTGVGVAPDELPRLFNAFTQSGNSSQQLVGTGLGLAISRRIVESMDGHIGADSQIGEGSNFWFEIPLMIADEPTSATVLSGPMKAFRQGKVLLAEDNEVNRMVVIGQLESLGVQVDAVYNGKEVLKAVGKSSYDLVLMDCQMPEMDGYEATRRLRSEESSEKATVGATRLPIVAITAHAFDGERERCLAAGMDDYLVKPFEEEQLAVVLDRWMHSSEAAATSATSSTASSTASSTSSTVG